MSKISVFNAQGHPAGDYQLDDKLLELKRGTQAVHDAVTAYRASRHAGTHKTKKRGEVSGGGIKPYKQKGTGRARAGSIRSPIWRGGGTIFGPQPRSYDIRMNRKVTRLAFRRAVSERISDGNLQMVEALALSAPKTRELAAMLKALALDKVLILAEAGNRSLILAARNMPEVLVVAPEKVNTYQILRYPRMLVTRGAMAVLEKRLGNPTGGGQ